MQYKLCGEQDRDRIKKIYDLNEILEAGRLIFRVERGVWGLAFEWSSGKRLGQS